MKIYTTKRRKTNKRETISKRKKLKKRILFRKVVNFFNKIKYLVLVLLLVPIIYSFFDGKVMFPITEIEILGDTNFVNRADLFELSKANVLDRSFFSINTIEVQNNLSKVFLGAKNIKVTKRFPSKVIVTVEERVPLALVSNSDQIDFYLVDVDGFVLGMVDKTTTNLPKIIYEDEIKIGDFIDRSVIPVYLDLINSLDESNVQFSSASANKRYVSFFVDNNIKVYIGVEKSISNSVKIIKELLNQLQLEGKEDVSRIDLRYDKVIVEY